MKDYDEFGGFCFVQTIALIIYTMAGAWSVYYLLEFFGLKTIHIFWAIIIGFIAGEVSIPVAIIIAILRFCEVI